ncbi:alpha/beta hydrolase [Actibacterium sp. 188UL27-1]|uniref:PHA/PHB synthase family protein n=1 Tax=Actibacterium sp. 188UL27-1 TaxID=2786961 RepID=UPI0019597ED0|nr:class I poly(R)-hydroxyalkanoic acid synthase [Actibacterium sp. 188UL27-1]MBM7068265.1 class I poly(R)-hydroxyalkanoic acid synthase [Actibacterium sp. 188UL27-1]
MTTDQNRTGGELDTLGSNLAKIEQLSRRVVTALSHQRSVPPGLQAPSNELFLKAATAYMTEMMANPAKIMEHQISFWGKTLKHHMEANQALASGHLTAPTDHTGKDRRFAGELWQNHPYFNYIKQQYLLSSEAITAAVADLDGLDDADKKRLDYFSRQIVDMFSPANFLGTNPDALARAVETEGQSLVDGLENMVRDLEANDGNLVVTLADREAFQVGENLGTTEGAVVYRNRMFELIQYAPQTDKVCRTPLVIFPPWINKFYILDLKEKNSLINWIVSQGYTLFVVSWVNPDPSYADVGMEQYIEEGYLAAIETVKAITGEDKINAVGYCIAGTTLGLTLSLMKKRKDTSLRSATFFTTLTDFSDQGEVGVFLDNDFVDAIEDEVADHGVLDSFFMSRTFSYLRSNDLIYAPAIKSYMMGEAPPAFDLLFWNGDGTNLPAKMAVEYLRYLCQDDRFARGEIQMFGETLSLADVDLPVCAIACETDHIAAWKSSYRGVQRMGSKQKTFILSESGHIAGIVNPPTKQKYGHYTNDDMTLTPVAWQEGARYNQGSWWPRWGAWLKKRSGAQVPARKLGTKDFPVLDAAPGTYVLAAE